MRVRTLLLVLLLGELASLTASFFPWLNTVGFFVIVGAALVLSLRRLEYGLYFVLAELVLGGKSGALFSLEYGGFFLSLRMALFIIVMSVWLAKLLSTKKLTIVSFLRQPILRWWGVLGLAVGWGVVVGIARGNNFGDLFLDANGYFYAALVLPFVWSITRKDTDGDGKTQMMTRVGTVFFAATTLLALKTLFAVYWFTHGGSNFIAANLVPFYRWVRDTGVGEITWLPGNFARVFFQSQVFNIAAFFVILNWMMIEKVKGGTKVKTWLLLVLNASVLIISLSRSFWVGVAVGLIVLGIGQRRQIGQIGRRVMIAAIAAVVLLFIVARFPLPLPSAIDFGAATRSRLAVESAVTSRWNLLPPLWKAVRDHPFVGSGFGTTVTYISNDPRIRQVSPTGLYTTYAFEWGWLDLWLKLGAVGLLLYVAFLGFLVHALVRRVNGDRRYAAGLASLAGLLAINVFTPYLNHPLGFGILFLLTVALRYDRLGKVVF